MNIELSFGEWLRQSRKIRGLTLSGIADAAGASNQSNLSKLERGQLVPELATLEKLAPYYGSPWLSDVQNVRFLKAVAWRKTSRPAYRPDTPEEVALFEQVRLALPQASDAVSAWIKIPEEAQNIAQIYAVEFPGVPGLGQRSLHEMHPFWVWIWFQHAQNLGWAERQILDDIRPGVDTNDPGQVDALSRLEQHWLYAQHLLHLWADLDAVNAVAAMVCSGLSRRARPWYEYPSITSGPIPDLSAYVVPSAKPQAVPSVSVELPDAWAKTIPLLVERSVNTPALQTVVELLLEYPPASLPSLAEFLARARSFDEKKTALI
ncbi:MAG: helix-turn-helix domain-containing protein [Firmicutes bacterium]|nr:helix-turn-helix domain-containing protein [Bacillota bacterium]